MQEVVKDDAVATQQESYFYARVAAAIDFILDVDKDLWRKHVMQQHSHLWDWKTNENTAQMGR